ncbi:MAG: XrtA/PEP-CTERM system TPR-repeat protein PrsT [Acidobacteriota bacterium]
MLCVSLLTACGNKSRDEMMLQGNQLVQQGNAKGAIVVFKNLLEKYPGDVPATLALAESYLSTGKFAQAEAEVKNLQQKASGMPEVSLLLAKIRISERKPQEALDALKPLLGDGASAEAWEQAGHALLLLGWLDESQRAYEKALAMAANRDKSRLGLAETYFKRNLIEQARREIDLMLQNSPQNQAALHMLAQIQTINNEDDAVIATYGKIGAAHPTDLKARYMEAFLRLAKKRDLDYAQSVATRLIADFPKSPEGYKLKGLVFLTKNEGTLALDPLLSANKIRPDVDTNLFLAQAYLGLGNLETAVSHLQTVLTARPELDGPRRMLASIYLRQNRLDDAISETQKVFERSPMDQAGQRIMADALVAKKEYDKGLELFTKLSEGEGAPSEVFLKRGMLLAMKGDNKAAEADLRKAVELADKALEPRIYLSSFLAEKGRIDEAVDVLGDRVSERPGEALSYNAMAKLRLRQGRLNTAIELLEKARQADPKVLITYYNLAALEASGGRFDKAAAQFEAALAVAPDDQRALAGAAGTWEALGDLAKAQAFLERAAANRNPQASLMLAGFFIRRSENAKALAVVDGMLETYPKETRGWIMKSQLHAMAGEQDKVLAALARLESVNQRLALLERAKFYLSVKKPEQAIEVAQKLRDMDPRSGDFSLPLAEIQELTGKAEAAKATLRGVLRDDPSNPRLYISLANMEARSKNTKEAIAVLDKGMAAGLDSATGSAMKGAIYQQMGEMKAAQEQYENALRFQERQPLALNNLAMIYADQAGSAPRALEMAVRAYTIDSNSPAVLDTLGYALLKNGRAKEAVAALERADKMASGNPEITKHLNMARELAQASKQ